MADFDEVKQQIAAQDSLKDFVNGLDDGKAQSKNTFDTYVSATKSILNWCNSATPLFDKLISEKDDGVPSQKEKKLLVTTLNDGKKLTWESLEKIRNSLPNLNNAIGAIVALLTQVAENESLKTKVQNLDTDITNLKSQLKYEVQIMSSLELQMQETDVFITVMNVYPEIYGKILASVERLLARCNYYRQRHE